MKAVLAASASYTINSPLNLIQINILNNIHERGNRLTVMNGSEFGQTAFV